MDLLDSPFVVTLAPNSDIFGNPQPLAAGLKREDVPKFYHDLLNVPNDLNEGHTLHEYWMGDSFGKYGVDLTVFGPYRMPAKSYQYGVDDEEEFDMFDDEESEGGEESEQKSSGYEDEF